MNSVLDIVVAHLEDHGCTGLHNPSEECACMLPDIAPCGEMKGECVPGVAYYCPENEGGEECPCGGEYDFHVEPPPLDPLLESYRIVFASKALKGGDEG